MKRFAWILVFVLAATALTGCGTSTQGATEAAIQHTVAAQDKIYNDSDPIPLFNYSLPRHLWIQFYKVQTSSIVRTWTCEVGMTGHPQSEVQQTIGYPIPMDTQLTNPHKLAAAWTSDLLSGSVSGATDGTLEQSEPNGLYTSPNTNSTIYFTANSDGSLSPNYCESFVVCKPYPFHWDDTRQIFVKDAGAKASINLDTKGASIATPTP